ncbi:TonB-dependent receptor plug domain-containing protein [Cognatitamlana onchidii]|uniref:TonB-dependent receptor plug domain-containing protein n=1 Tax=Cognatitamlana onchidii TaxID=2562860 RepID=UPI0010A5C423|nr:TonB-dependent receptor [Algibacter onchidii]
MNKKTNVFGILCLGVSWFGFAQQEVDSMKVEQLDEVVISDSRFALKRENSGKTVIQISQEEIDKNQGRTVSELINTKSGIEINGSRSNAGQNLGTYVRGGRNRQVLVMIDGVQVNDPSQLSGEYDFRLLNLSQIESIEIIKGAASTLYGSGAATAVVNIKSKKASEKKLRSVVASSIGTNQSQEDQNYNISDFNNSFAVDGTLNKFTYRAGFNQQFTDGMSAVITKENEKDAFSKYGVDVNLGYNFSDAFSLQIFGNYTDVNAEIDGYDASFMLTDTDDRFKSKQSRTGLSAAYKYNNGSIHLNAAYSAYDREFISSFPSVFESKNYVADFYNKYVFNDKFYTILGVNAIENSAVFSEEKTFTIVDPYANVVYVSDFGLNVNAGVRMNNHSEYGSHFTYNVNPSYVMKYDNSSYSKLFGSYSTSYIAPSLSQLFGNFGPNPNLEPEENRTIEGGLEYKMSNRLRVSGLYFNREEKNFVVYDFTLGYLNAADLVKTQGFELEVDANIAKSLNLTANYTFVENKDDDPVRIPKHKGNLLLGYDFSQKTFASLAYQYTGDRLDNGNVTLDSFSLFNFYISHTALKNKIKFFAGIDNILNEDYLEIANYTTKGRNARIGFQLTL